MIKQKNNQLKKMEKLKKMEQLKKMELVKNQLLQMEPKQTLK